MVGSLRKRDRAREYLLGLVESRAVGQAIPSERQLSAELDISRPTLRAVVDDLVRDGRLVREHGRGMFVGNPKVAQQITGTHGATAPGTWTSRVLSHATIQAGTLIGNRLQVTPNTAVLRIARQRLVNGDPICLETIHVLQEIVPDFDVQAVEQNSFYTLLEEHYGVIPTDAEQTHAAAAADAIESALLGLALDAPILILERTTRDQNGRRFEFTRAAYRGDRYQVSTHLSLAKPTGDPPLAD
ncbi:GntR family transcriptional regulator [Kribbella voronezhensis]|uniref:GntR family transcriptional regulator n=1 Tax=Kribbella voronezhensis TaxID=2512212 RepID=A0A4R7SZK7_9ACTN|nr:GntR family transcriptional regulator [Kribbella voronezhensis]TDU83988.1 GntR family transcriptional regulator [Kribbella voronezhensis]